MITASMIQQQFGQTSLVYLLVFQSAKVGKY